MSESAPLSHLSFLQRLMIRLVGPTLAFAFRTNFQKFLGIPLSGWVKWLPIWFIPFVLIGRFSVNWIWVLLGLFILLQAGYWLAQRIGYSRFVADPKASNFQTKTIPEGEKILLRATGLFSLAQREERVFLRPSEFWQVPLGERVIMVKAPNELFLYQFFEDESVKTVKSGWLVFGRTPLPSLAITFCVSWGPAFDENPSFYYVGDGPDKPPCQNRTVYLTFEDESSLSLVAGCLTGAIGG